MAVVNSSIEFITGNKKNCETFNKGPAAGARSANHDLFKKTFISISSSSLKVKVRWMASHLRDKLSANSEFQLPDFVTMNDVTGNQWADDLAGQSATSEELPLNTTTPYLYYYNLTKRIQKRLTVIMCSLPNRPKHIPKAKVPCESLTECCNLSRHVIYDVDKSHLGCARCRQVRARYGVGIRHWLGSECQPRVDSWDRPIPIYGEFVQIGTQSIHISHKVYSYKIYITVLIVDHMPLIS